MNSGSYTHLERRGTGLPDNGLSFSLGDARDRSPSVGIGAVVGIKEVSVKTTGKMPAYPVDE